jgi:glutamate synthase domain-containing protein 3
MVGLERLSGPDDIKVLKELIDKHLELTESARAKEILADWAKYEPLFWKVCPQPPVQPPSGSAQTATVAPPSPTPPGASGDGVLAPATP